jgi:hypothetical protein
MLSRILTRAVITASKVSRSNWCLSRNTKVGKSSIGLDFIDWAVCSLGRRLGICTYYRHWAPSQWVIISSLTWLRVHESNVCLRLMRPSWNHLQSNPQNLATHRGIEPLTSDRQSGMIPLHQWAIVIWLRLQGSNLRPKD